MQDNSFKFKLVDIVPFVKGDRHMARIVCYCSYGFIVNLFTTEEKANQLKLKSKEPNFDMTKFVNVFYDNKANQFAYIINIK